MLQRISVVLAWMISLTLTQSSTQAQPYQSEIPVLVGKGYELFVNGPEEAIPILERALALYSLHSYRNDAQHLQILALLAASNFRLDSDQEAHKYLSVFDTAMQNAVDPTNKVFGLDYLAHVLVMARERQTAKAAMDKLLKLLVTHSVYGWCHSNHDWCQLEAKSIVGRLTELEMQKEGVEFAKKLIATEKDETFLLDLYTFIGIGHSRMQKYELALEAHEKALQIAKALPDTCSIDQLNALLWVGNDLMDLGDFKAAVEYRKAVLDFLNSGSCQTLGDEGFVFLKVTALDIISHLYLAMNLVQQGELYSQEANTFLDMKRTMLPEATYLHLKYYLLEAQIKATIQTRRWEDAAIYVGEQLEVAQKSSEKSWETNALNHLVEVDLELGLISQAQEYANLAIKNIQNFDNPPTEWNLFVEVLVNAAKAFKIGSPPWNPVDCATVTSDNLECKGSTLPVYVKYANEAVSSYANQCLNQPVLEPGRCRVAFSKLSELILDQFPGLVLLTESQLGLLREQQATSNLTLPALDNYYRDTLDNGLKIAGVYEDTALELSYLLKLGDFYSSQGKPISAAQFLQKAADVFDKFQVYLTVEDLSSRLIEATGNVYEKTIKALVEVGFVEQAFTYSEKARSRAFLNSMAAADQLREAARREHPVVGKEYELRTKLAYMENPLALEIYRNYEHSQAPVPFIDALAAEEGAEFTTTVRNFRKEHEETLQKLKLELPEYASFVAPLTTTLRSVQSSLANETTLIEYFVSDPKIYAWVINPEKYDLVILNMTSNVLGETVANLRSNLEKTVNPKTTLEMLYREVFEPLVPLILHKNVIIVPHGALHYVPFSALLNANTDRFLIEDYSVTITPSATILQFIREKETPYNGKALIVGNPDGSLPFAQAEAAGVSAELNKLPIIGADATETRIRGLIENADIIHVSAHAFYDNENPELSYVQLLGDGSNDGTLTTAEIFGLDLTEANLVVLSACETGLGSQANGDEIVAMNRAFLFAGAPAVMSTLWKVDDNVTARLMVQFYKHFTVEGRAATALQLAQIEVMKQWRNPYYWAGFVLYGDPSLLDNTGEITASSLRYLLMSLMIVLFPALIGVGWFLRKRKMTL